MFINVRMPEGIEKGVLGGSMFNTEVLPLDSGQEFRNENWSIARGQWDVGYGVRRVAEDPAANLDITVSELTAFFHVMRGKVNSFRFKDHANFKIGDPLDPDTDHQTIGIGDASNKTFQAFKQFTFTGTSEVYNKPVTKLVTGTVSVYLNDVKQVSGFTVNHNTGAITFTVAPGVGVDVAIAAEFDHHVRFDTDHLQINLEHIDLGSWPNIPLIELLLEDET